MCSTQIYSLQIANLGNVHLNNIDFDITITFTYQKSLLYAIRVPFSHIEVRYLKQNSKLLVF